MSKTTTKTTTVTEEFDKDGNLTKRVTETSEETFEDAEPVRPFLPNPSPWVNPPTVWGSGIYEVKCTCLSGYCAKHCVTINTQTSNPSSAHWTVNIADGQFDKLIKEGPIVVRADKDLLDTIRVYPDDSTVAQDAVSEDSVYEGDYECGDSTCGCSN